MVDLDPFNWVPNSLSMNWIRTQMSAEVLVLRSHRQPCVLELFSRRENNEAFLLLCSSSILSARRWLHARLLRQRSAPMALPVSPPSLLTPRRSSSSSSLPSFLLLMWIPSRETDPFFPFWLSSDHRGRAAPAQKVLSFSFCDSDPGFLIPLGLVI